jgi:hypothetical protein
LLFSNEKLLLLLSLFVFCFLGTLHLQSNEQRSFFYSKQTSTQTYKGNKQTNKNNAPIKTKTLKEHTKGYARFYGCTQTKEKLKTKLRLKKQACVRSLTNKRLGVGFILNRKIVWEDYCREILYVRIK